MGANSLWTTKISTYNISGKTVKEVEDEADRIVERSVGQKALFKKSWTGKDLLQYIKLKVEEEA